MAEQQGDGSKFEMLNKEQDKLIGELRASEGKYEKEKGVEDEFEGGAGVVSHGGEVKHPAENKTIMEKIKDKLPFPLAESEDREKEKEKEEAKDKKGILENIKEKLNKD